MVHTIQLIVQQAFKQAARMLCKPEYLSVNPLLEPITHLEVTTPSELLLKCCNWSAAAGQILGYEGEK